jgi:hypothetical protein
MCAFAAAVPAADLTGTHRGTMPPSFTELSTDIIPSITLPAPPHPPLSPLPLAGEIVFRHSSRRGAHKVHLHHRCRPSPMPPTLFSYLNISLISVALARCHCAVAAAAVAAAACAAAVADARTAAAAADARAAAADGDDRAADARANAAAADDDARAASAAAARSSDR